ncbi:MAG: helix-turn-helix domain-containing protein [Lachnospiraceae bacterium]|nr:helix-turn-helix domain-containing protein [Lachnospiraceae bacterium]
MDKLCKILDCDVLDIISYEPDTQKAEMPTC